MTIHVLFVIFGFVIAGCDPSEIGDELSSDIHDDSGGSDPSALDDSDTASDSEENPSQAPVEFVLVNKTDSTRFITIDDYNNTPEHRLKNLRFEHEVLGEWKAQNMRYNNLCEAIEQGRQCTYLGDFWDTALPIEPGESLLVIWEGVTYRRDDVYCDDDGLEGCYWTDNPEPGRYRLSVDVGDACVSFYPDGVCYPSDGGMSFASGAIETYHFELDVPCDVPRLIFNIE